MAIVWDAMRAVVNGNDNNPKSGFTSDMISSMKSNSNHHLMTYRHNRYSGKNDRYNRYDENNSYGSNNRNDRKGNKDQGEIIQKNQVILRMIMTNVVVHILET